MSDIGVVPHRSNRRIVRCGCRLRDVGQNLWCADPTGEKRYSPAECTGAVKHRIEGNPDPKHVSTSYAERQNLTMRMQMRRYTRLTNAFSKKFDNHVHMVALYTVWYNYVKQHKSLKGLSPAMAAGISSTLWSMTELAEMVMGSATILLALVKPATFRPALHPTAMRSMLNKILSGR